MKLSIDISVPSPLWRRLPRARSIARETIAAALPALNLSWGGFDKPTNVLSFCAAPGRAGEAQTLGDIALAYETLAREAEDFGVPLGDHYRHLLVHGFLHLIGYDHETDAEAERMEALETKILARLGVADPYAREVVGG